MLPSKDDIPTNSVNTIPSTQITLLLRNLASLSFCTFEEILEIMLSETDIRAIGINIVFMKLPINVIINSIIGCSMPAEAIFPVVTINVINSGISAFEKEIRFCIEFFIITIISEKFFIMIVTIKIYVT